VTKHFYPDQDTFVTQSGYRTRLGYRFPIGNNVVLVNGQTGWIKTNQN